MRWSASRPTLWHQQPRADFENLYLIPLPGGPNYGGPPSDVHAYDVRTGKLAWIFHVIPHEGEFGYDTWPEGHYKVSGGGHNWSEFTVDEENGIAFVGFGSPRYDFYGGDRKDINPYLPKEAQDELRARLRSYRNEGLFTPPSFEGSVQMPGHNGGANFGTSAVDPDRGEFYVVHKSLPTVIRITMPAPPRGQGLVAAAVAMRSSRRSRRRS